MNKTTAVACKILIFTLLIFEPRAVLAVGVNLLKDPGFEQGLEPAKGGWILFDESSISNDVAHSGSRSMFNWGFSRAVPYPPFLQGSVSGSYQEFPAAAGSRWRLTGYGMAPTQLQGAPAFGVVQLSFFDALGNDLGTVETADAKTPRAKISNEVNAGTPAGEWIFLDTGIVTAPEDAVVIHAFTLFVDYSGSGRSQRVYFDDLSLCAVAEDAPASACE